MIKKSFMVRVGADTKDMERGLKSARAKMKAFGNQIKKIGKVTAVAGAAVAGAVGLMVKNYIKAGDEVHKMALRTGFSTESLSELKYASDISGASLESLEKGVKKMSKTILDASDGLMTYVRAFDRIGLKAEELMELSPEDQFDRIARAIARVESPTIRAATAQEIFGRAGTQLLPLFAEGEAGLEKLRKKAHELGLVFDQEAANKAAALTDSLTTLKGAIKGVSMSIVSETIPILTVLADKFTEVFVGIREEGRTLSSMIVGFFETIVGATGAVLTGFKAFYIAMLTLNKKMAEGLIAIVESIEYTAAMSKNYAIQAKVLSWTAEALEKLNKVRNLDIELIKKEEDALATLMEFFKNLKREIAAVGDAYKKAGERITESVLPPARELVDVLEKIEGATLPAARSLGDVLGAAVTDMSSDVYEYKKAWQDTMYEILDGVGSAVGAMDSLFGQFHANEAMRIDNEERKKTEALESWYEREKAKIESTITDEQELADALVALEETKAEKEAALQEKIEKERKKLELKRAKAQKKSALFAAGMNVAEAITKALTAGPLIGQIFAGVVAALGAIQVAAIAAAPLPALKTGGFIEKEMIARLHPGEYVVSAPDVRALTSPAREAMPMPSTFSPTVNIYAKYLDDRTIDRAAEKIFARLKMEEERYT